MNRTKLRAAIIGSVALVLACNDQVTTSVAGVDGTYDIAISGDLLFVTATDQNELRVVNLAATPPDWVRAPNPLHPLSIPVVDRPIGLVRDVIWDSGNDVGGNYVYVRSANGREISVVDRVALREVAVITASATEEITALAARGGAADQPSTLYVATWDGQRSTIRTLSVPAPAQLESDPAGECTGIENARRRCYPLTGTVVTGAACASVASLLVLPGATQMGIAFRPSPDIETRCTAAEAALFQTATSFIFESTNASFTPLLFGAPVRQLFTNPAFGEEPAGSRIYGVLDENRCAAERGARCRGVLAVVGTQEWRGPQTAGVCGTAIGEVACDVTGAPMLPINPGGPLIMGAAVGVGTIGIPGFAIPPQGSRLLGVVTTSNGQLRFWDAEHLRDFDVATNENVEARATTGTMTMVNQDGTRTLTLDGGPVPATLEVAEGAARDEEIFITYRGTLPQFERIPAPAVMGATLIDVEANPVDIVQVGDAVEVNAAEGCAGGVGSKVATVSSSSSRAGGGGTLTVVWEENVSIPPNCTLAVRPAEADPNPWVVLGTSSGYLGRIAPAPDLVHKLPAEFDRRRALYYHHPLGFDWNAPAPLISFAFSAPAATPFIGLSYIVPTVGNFRPASLAVDPNLRLGRQDFVNVAGSVVFRPGTNNIYVAFPSGDVVLQIPTRVLQASGAVSEYQVFR